MSSAYERPSAAECSEIAFQARLLPPVRFHKAEQFHAPPSSILFRCLQLRQIGPRPYELHARSSWNVFQSELKFEGSAIALRLSSLALSQTNSPMTAFRILAAEAR